MGIVPGSRRTRPVALMPVRPGHRLAVRVGLFGQLSVESSGLGVIPELVEDSLGFCQVAMRLG